MSTGNDIQLIPSNHPVQTDDQGSVITHQPPTNYYQINTQTMLSDYQNPVSPSYVYQNGRMIPVGYTSNGIILPTVVMRNSASTCDYLNIIWASCNILCCFFLVGIVALVISILTLNMQRNGNDKGARCGHIWATLINPFATITGIIAIIIISLKYTQ